MEGGSTAAPSASSGDQGAYNNDSSGAPSSTAGRNGASGNNNNNNNNNHNHNHNNNNSHNNGSMNGSGRAGSRRLSNIEQQLLAEDNAAASGGFYSRGQAAAPGLQGVGAAGLGMYGGPNDAAAQGARAQQMNSLYGAAGFPGAAGLGGPGGFRGVPGLLPGQFEDPSGGLAGLQGAGGPAGLGGLNAMNGLGVRGPASALQQQQQQAMVAQQQALAAQQQAGGADFQGLMPTGFEGTDASALLGNPAAMAGYPMFNPAAAGLGVGPDGAPGGPGLMNPNAQGLGAGAPGAAMAAARNAAAGTGAPSLFDQGYNFARSEMALVRHQAALNNNLMGGVGLAGLDRQGAAGLRALGPNPYGQYGADQLMGAAGPVGSDPYLGRGGVEGGPNPQHLATIPAIRLAQHRSALQRRMMVNSLPERKDGSFPVVLYQESDEHKLTAYQCLLRKQLELFEADEDDVRCSTRQGRTAPIKLGQVGLRCRHCAGVQLAARTKGAAYYSQTVEGIYQIAQNMSKVHLCERCYRIPRDVRRQLIVLRSDCRRAIGGKEYWSENIRALGVYVDEGILRVKRAPKEESKDGEEGSKDSGGESKEGDNDVKMENTKEEEGDTDGVVPKKEDEQTNGEKEQKEKVGEDEATPMDDDDKEEKTGDNQKTDKDIKEETMEDGDAETKKDDEVAEQKLAEEDNSSDEKEIEKSPSREDKDEQKEEEEEEEKKTKEDDMEVDVDKSDSKTTDKSEDEKEEMKEEEKEGEKEEETEEEKDVEKETEEEEERKEEEEEDQKEQGEVEQEIEQEQEQEQGDEENEQEQKKEDEEETKEEQEEDEKTDVGDEGDENGSDDDDSTKDPIVC